MKKITIFLILFIFIFNSFVYGASTFNSDYDYLYKFKIDNEFTYTCNEGSTSVSNINKYIENDLADDRVKSGDYYYFIFNHLWSGLCNVLVKKSSIGTVSLSYSLARNDLNTILYNLNFNTSDVIWLNGRSDRNGNFGFYCDSETNTLIGNFVTNYDDDIYIKLTNGSERLFYSGKQVPKISNSADGLANLDIDNLLINPGGYSSDELEFVLFDYSNGSVLFRINLSDYTDYIEREYDDNPFSDLIYVIPLNVLPSFSVVNGFTYDWAILYGDTGQVDLIVTSRVSMSIDGSGESSEEDERNEELKDAISDSTDKIIESNNKTQEKLEEQTEAIKENNETNKNIFEKIGEILSYLNPFSENFFAYKLVELIVDGLKSLFVPSDNFFSNWLDDLNAYFGETFGILYYPAELIIEFLNRVGNIAETDTAIISVPSFTLSFMGHSATFFEDMSYDLNTILENNTFKTIHDIYLIFTDIILWLSVVYLASKMIRTILGGMGDEIQSAAEESQESERSYERYKQYQSNKKRYKEENKRK